MNDTSTDQPLPTPTPAGLAARVTARPETLALPTQPDVTAVADSQPSLSVAAADANPLCVSVGMAVHSSDTRTAFAYVTDTGIEFALEVPHTDSITPVFLAAFEHMIANEALAGVGIDFYCPSRKFVDAITPLASSWPHVTIQPWTETRATGLLVRTARKQARDLVDPVIVSIAPQATEPSTPTPLPGTRRRLYAATDGSTGWRKKGLVSGFGWITENGRHGFGTVEGPILVAEIKAIHALLAGTPWDQPLTVLVDSKPALNAVTSIQRGTKPSALTIPNMSRHHRWMEELAKLVRGRDVQFQKVAAHTGHPLNEGADSIAVAARRAAQMDLPDDTLRAVIQGIRERVAEGLTATPLPRHAA